MKKLAVVFVSIFAAFIALSSFTPGKLSPQDQTVKIKGIPEDVSAIIGQKCYGCHNSESRNEDAKKELSFDKWDELNTLQKLSKTKEVHETVTKAEMPPKKFLKRFPDRSLTEEEMKLLVDWANKELGK